MDNEYAISELDPSDFGEFLTLASDFSSEMPMPFPVQLEETILRLKAIVLGGMGFVLGLYHNGIPCGMLGAVICPDLYSGALTASEVFWFVSEKHRGVGKYLVEEFEIVSRERGVRRTTMVRMLSHTRFEQLDGFYKRRGYNPAEVVYIKEL